MTRSHGLVLATCLMAATASAALAQATVTQSDPATPLPGSSPSDIIPAPMPGDDAETQDSPQMPGTGTTPPQPTAEQNMQNREILDALSQPSAAGIDWEETFATLPDEAAVQIITLSDLADADDGAEPLLDQAMINLDNDQDALRRAIENNAALLSAVEDEGYAVEDVVAALMHPDMPDDVTLIVDAGPTVNFGTEDATGETDL